MSVFPLLLIACTSEVPGHTASEEPETVDVIVVGTGPAGAASAIAAVEAGATVTVFEREDVAGEGLRLAGFGLGVATTWQAEAGISDSLELAEADWPNVTGELGDDPAVVAYLSGTADTLDWLAGHHTTIGFDAQNASEGSVPRLHEFGWGNVDDPWGTLLADTPAALELGIEVTAPLIEEGRVVGVTWRTVATGETGTLRAGAVVLATGGFLRDLDAVAEVRPDLAGRSPVFETNPSSTGGGLPFLVAVGAARYRPERIGAFLHSIVDPFIPGDEALILSSGPAHFYVGDDGLRFGDDSSYNSFEIVDMAPETVWSISSGANAVDTIFLPPAYNWSVQRVPETFTVTDLLASGSADVVLADTLSELEVATGIDWMLTRTVAEYNTEAAAGQTDEFGRALRPEDALIDGPWLALRLRPGLAKAFGGVATDLDGHVLDSAGEPIAGLYAAGEVVGMILGGGSGTGFAGSSTACYQGGRTAGTNAAGEALGSR